jgi:hypothetical protein
MNSENGMRASDSQNTSRHDTRIQKRKDGLMDRSLVQAKQSRSAADESGEIAQGAVKTAVRPRRTGLVRHASGCLRLPRVPMKAPVGAGSVGCQRHSMAASTLARRRSADPTTDLTLPVCPRQSDATADRVRRRLHGVP